MLDGATAVASSNKGQLFVFVETPAGWVESQILTPPSIGPGQGLGSGMALDGDLMLVGAPFDSAAMNFAGSCVAFERVGGLWVEVQKLLPSNPSVDLNFGNDVAIDGNRAIIGAPSNMGTNQPGTAYVFEWNGAQWIEVAQLQGGDTVPDDLFADQVDLSGEHAVVGAWLSQSSAGWRSGGVYVFERQAGGSWVQMGSKLVGSDTGAFDNFGRDVAIDGQWLVAGAFHKSVETSQDGRAYVFQLVANQWVEHTILLAPKEDLNQWFRFGEAVALEGERMLVRANFFREDVFLYRFTGGQWIWEEKLRSEPGPTGAGGQHLLGFSMDISGYRVLLSEPAYFNGDHSIVIFDLAPGSSRSCFCSSGPYCHDDHGGCRTSTGRGAPLSACGSASVSADDLLLHSWALPVGQLGMLLMGNGSKDTPLGDGRLCVGGNIFRFAVGSANAFQHRVSGPGLVAHSLANFPVAGHIQAGDTWHFQYWFRDPIGYSCVGLQNLATGNNLSNVVTVTFT